MKENDVREMSEAERENYKGVTLDISEKGNGNFKKRNVNPHGFSNGSGVHSILVNLLIKLLNFPEQSFLFRTVTLSIAALCIAAFVIFLLPAVFVVIGYRDSCLHFLLHDVKMEIYKLSGSITAYTVKLLRSDMGAS